MGFDLSRLRRGELIAGASGALLLAFTFLLTWYGRKPPAGWTAATLGVPISFTGWDLLSHIRYLVLITALLALALVYLQATRPAPAIAVSISAVLSVLALLTVIVLLYRVLINVPGPGDLHRRVGAYLGLLSSVGIFYGAYLSLRREGIAEEDGAWEIELVRLGGADEAEHAASPAAPTGAEAPTA